MNTIDMIAPGARVVIRDAEWLVRKVRLDHNMAPPPWQSLFNSINIYLHSFLHNFCVDLSIAD